MQMESWYAFMIRAHFYERKQGESAALKTREPFLKLNYKKILLGVSGSAIVAFGVYNVHNVADITEGGILGLNLLLEYWLGISPAFTNAILTVICFIIGWKALGRDFIAYSLFFAAAFSLFYRILEKYTPLLFPQLAYHPWPASLIGCLFVGVGAGKR